MGQTRGSFGAGPEELRVRSDRVRWDSARVAYDLSIRQIVDVGTGRVGWD